MTAAQTFNNQLLTLWTDHSLQTPAFVYDMTAIKRKLDLLNSVRTSSGCKVLYSIKALSFAELLQNIAPQVDGFSVSSLFEARLAYEVSGKRDDIHLATPGIQPCDMSELAQCTGYISFNSLQQWQRCRPHVQNIKCGLRINPGLSFVQDARYDPCRPVSKLGVPLSQLVQADAESLRDISGLHVHNNCEAGDYTQLHQTVGKLVDQHHRLIRKLQWLNLGGGYLIENQQQMDMLNQLVSTLKQQFDLEIFFEPGKGIVGNAGYLVAGVIDIFESDGKQIAILDTTVNHLPEIFEYQYRPVILNESPDGQYQYRLAGCSCLSGDLFGDYCFDQPLEIGSRIIFSNIGAYMLVKASMFNGINLPTIYTLQADARLTLVKQYAYADYRGRL